ncbi:MAG: HNH endonuclease [Planctomycetes bacterium]|nr:HNH endonuclease [Planctomycetota bacterium]
MSVGFEGSVLVLNKFYLPINMISVKRAFVILYKDTGEILDEVDSQIRPFSFNEWIDFSADRNGDRDYVRTIRHRIAIPRIIRLTRCFSMPKYEVKLTKKNVLLRDGYKCQYCNKGYQLNKLTIDHIIPKSKGGKSVWTNIVTACMNCNLKKGGRLPWEVGMKLLRSPSAPHTNPLLSQKLRNGNYKVWGYFLNNADI